MDFGVRLPVAGPLANARNIATVARAAEDHGFHHISVHDFIAWSRFQDRTHISCGSVEVAEAAGDGPANFYDSLSSVAYVAGITSRVRLLISVLVLPFRNPIVTAKQIATIDNLSEGRLILGVGVGAARSTHNSDFELLGVSRVDKYDRMPDYLRAMQALWNEDEPAYDGPFVRFGPTRMDPKPVQRPSPPIWVGGGGARSVRIAAELGDGWIPPWLTPSGYVERIADLRDQAARFGRPAPATIAATTHALIDPSTERARELALPTLRVMTVGFADDATPEAIDSSGLIGSPELIAGRIAAYRDAGLTAIELRFIYHSIDHLLDQLELFASEVVPALDGSGTPESG